VALCSDRREKKTLGRGRHAQPLRGTLESPKQNLTQTIAAWVKMTFLSCRAVWRDLSLPGNIWSE